MSISEEAVQASEVQPCPPDHPLVSVIVVNYNGGKNLRQCLDSLLVDKNTSREVLIVDNASTDESPMVLRTIAALHPDLTVIWNSQNVGYAGAVNVALNSARGAFVAVLNMDVSVARDWLTPLLTFLQEHPAAGAVNPLLLTSGEGRINAAGQDVHITGLGFNRFLGRPVERVGKAPVRVSGLQGGAFLIRRALLDRAGGMDATGFLYHEDVNLSWLVQLMGFTLYCVPQSVVYHDYFLSMYPTKLYFLERNRWSMLLAYLYWPTLILLAPALFVTEALIWCYCIIRGWGFVRAKLSSYRWIWRRWPDIQKRRRLADSVRVISDWSMLKNLRWAYAIDQFMVLGRERGDSLRQPAGGIPKEAIDS